MGNPVVDVRITGAAIVVTFADGSTASPTTCRLLRVTEQTKPPGMRRLRQRRRRLRRDTTTAQAQTNGGR